MNTINKNTAVIPIGRAIEAIMDEQGISILELSARCHLWPSVISSVLKRNDCRLKTLVKLSQGLGLNPSELLARAEALQET